MLKFLFILTLKTKNLLIKLFKNNYITSSESSEEIYEIINKYKLYRLYISLNFGYQFNSN